MRVRSLFTALALAASGCAGLDPALFDDGELTRLLEEPEAAPKAPPGSRAEPPAPPAPSDAQATTPATEADPGRSRPQDDRIEVAALDRAIFDDVLADDTPEKAGQGGVIVASVGAEEIRLPELTRAVRGRIERLPDGRTPTRREVIGMVRAEMESRILASLVGQQARKSIEDGQELAALRESIGRRWTESELPRILDREGLAGAEALDGRLSERGRSLDDLRIAFENRALARELIRREGLDGEDVDAYLGRLRDRFPIASDLIPAGREALAE